MSKKTEIRQDTAAVTASKAAHTEHTERTKLTDQVHVFIKGLEIADAVPSHAGSATNRHAHAAALVEKVAENDHRTLGLLLLRLLLMLLLVLRLRKGWAG